MTAAPDARKRLIAALHAEAKRAGLDEELRREVMRQATGKASAAEMTLPELGRALDAIKGRSAARRRVPRASQAADSPHARKARALWLSLWHLGAIADPTEEALAAFALRQCGVAALQWVSPRDAGRIIEALRAMAGRAGFAATTGIDTATAQRDLVAAQLAILDGLGIAPGAGFEGARLVHLSGASTAHRMIGRLGEMIRKAKGRAHD